MQVRLSAKLQELVRQLVADGKYASTDEVIAHAVARLGREELRADLEAGMKDVREGRVVDWSLDEAKQELLRRVRRKKKAS
jgi:Arc/MetJ-type ribon-helix-helix transcriptional regulator